MEGGDMKYSVFSGVLPELSPEEAVEAIARNGYDGVEWRVNGEYHFPAAEIEKHTARIRSLSAGAGLDVVSLTGYTPLDDSEDLRRMTAAAGEIGCPRFRAFAAHYDPDEDYWAQHDRIRADLDTVENVVRGSGVKALLEVHFGTLLASPSLAWEIMRDHDPALVGVILDPANTVIEGAMPTRMGLDMLGPYVDLVHVKNICWERTDEDGGWRWRFADLVEGQLDWTECIPALRQSGYDGYLSFENLNRVPVRHTGYVDEELIGAGGAMRDIDERLSEERTYIGGLVDAA
jgi:sugar phosphate isomerase/epimerase